MKMTLNISVQERETEHANCRFVRPMRTDVSGYVLKHIFEHINTNEHNTTQHKNAQVHVETRNTL